MLSPNPGASLDNKLLSALPRAQFDFLTPHMSTKEVAQGLVLLDAGDKFDHVYFPTAECFRCWWCCVAERPSKLPP